MTGITDKNSGGTTLVSYGYTYDAAGLVSQEVRVWDSGSDTDTLTYDYTENDQLTSVTHTNDAFANESFTYDANGNETGSGYTTTTGNEQTASPGYTYTYDADGNMLTSTQTSTGDVWTYTYNFRNLMTGAVETNSDDTIIAQVTYTYDALDNRIGMDENGTQTWTLYDGSKPIMDFSAGGSLETRYLNGPTGQLVDAVLANEGAGEAIAWYLPDRLGTVRDLISNTGGIIDHVDYSAFGTMLDESDPSEGGRMVGFAGMEPDTVTGLNLAVNRAQDPGTGRWASQDPLGFGAGDTNLYRYVGNNAVNRFDVTGDGPDSISGSFWAAIVAGNFAEALAILETAASVGVNIANNVKTGATAISVLVAKALADFPAKAQQCTLAAQRVAHVFRAAGQSPTIITIRDKFGAKFFFLPDGTKFASTGFHQAVLVGGRVYDCLTGANGMTLAQYLAYLAKLGISPIVK